MILSKQAIIAHIKNSAIGIEPFTEQNLKQASYTLTLGRVIRIAAEKKLRPDIAGRSYKDITMDEQGHVLEPGAFVPGSSREKITLPENICAMLSNRGTCARMGIDVTQSSFFIEPESDNVMVFEIKNNNVIPVTVFPEMQIAKCIFMHVVNK